MALEFKDLIIGYKNSCKSQQIAGPFDLKIPEKKLTAVIGKNGAGKTTLIKTIGQQLKSLNGAVLLDGQSIEKIPNDQRARLVSFVFTTTLSSENMSVYELVALGRYPFLNWYSKPSKKDAECIQEAIVFTALEGLENTKIHALSDGQKQRAFIARALAQETPYMILDEPMSHLDHHHKAQLLSLMKKLVNEKDKTIVYTTHDIEKAITNADFILALTEDKSFFNTPDNLIKEGVFDILFPQEQVYFNPATSQFLYRDPKSK